MYLIDNLVRDHAQSCCSAYQATWPSWRQLKYCWVLSLLVSGFLLVVQIELPPRCWNNQLRLILDDLFTAKDRKKHTHTEIPAAQFSQMTEMSFQSCIFILRTRNGFSSKSSQVLPIVSLQLDFCCCFCWIFEMSKDTKKPATLWFARIHTYTCIFMASAESDFSRNQFFYVRHAFKRCLHLAHLKVVNRKIGQRNHIIQFFDQSNFQHNNNKCKTTTKIGIQNSIQIARWVSMR